MLLRRDDAPGGALWRLIENLPDAVLVASVHDDHTPGKFVEANATACRWLGYTRDEFLALTPQDINPGSSAEEIRSRVSLVAAQGTLSFETVIVAKDGRHLNVETHMLHLQAGTERYNFSVSRDITARMRNDAELERYREALEQLVETRTTALAQAEASWRVLIAQASDAIFVSGPEAQLIEVNDAAQAMLGYTRDELMRLTAHDLLDPTDTVSPRMDALLRGEVVFSERRLRRKDGTLVPVEISARRLTDGRMLGIVRDVTERNWAVQRLADSEHLYRTLVETSPDGISLTDQEGRIVSINAQGAHLLGFAHPQELVGRSWAEFGCPLRAGSTIATGEREMVRRDGERFHASVHVAPLLGGAGAPAGLVVILRDATEPHRLRAALDQAQRLDAIGRLAGGIAHDFNNLLTVIKGYSDLALENLGADSRAHADVAEIRRAAERAALLTGQLLAFSRRQPIVPRRISPNAVLRDVASRLQRVSGVNVQVAVDLAQDGGDVMLDPQQLEQVVTNLAVNARDAMPGGGTLRFATRNVELTRDHLALLPDVSPGLYVRITVQDDGAGIAPEVLPHIFEPFFTTKEVGKGTGLGLAMVYGVIKQNAGHLEVTSDVGKGTEFRLYFKRVDAMPTASTLPLVTPEAARRATLLVVEDDEAVRGLVAEILSEEGYGVVTAASGEEALAQYERYGNTVALVLTDVIMPGMGGLKLAAELRQRRPGMRIVYMSGYTDDILGIQGRLDPNVQFLPKPIEITTLLAKIRAMLDSGAQAVL